MTETNWYYAQDNQKQGPVPEGALIQLVNQLSITAQTLVWSKSLTNWTPAGQVDELNYLFVQPPQPEPVSPVGFGVEHRVHDLLASGAEPSVDLNQGLTISEHQEAASNNYSPFSSSQVSPVPESIVSPVSDVIDRSATDKTTPAPSWGSSELSALSSPETANREPRYFAPAPDSPVRLVVTPDSGSSIGSVPATDGSAATSMGAQSFLSEGVVEKHSSTTPWASAPHTYETENVAETNSSATQWGAGQQAAASENIAESHSSPTPWGTNNWAANPANPELAGAAPSSNESAPITWGGPRIGARADSQAPPSGGTGSETGSRNPANRSNQYQPDHENQLDQAYQLDRSYKSEKPNQEVQSSNQGPGPLVELYQRPGYALAQADLTPHPWLRYFARVLDGSVFASTFAVLITSPIWIVSLWSLGAAAGHAGPSLNIAAIGVVVAIMLSWLTAYILYEPLLIGKFGSTAGKVLFNIRVTNEDGSMPGMGKSFTRWFFMLLRSGLLFANIVPLVGPLISLVLHCIAYNNLNNNGATSWDTENGLVCSHNGMSALRWTAVAFVVLGLTLFLIAAVIVQLLAYNSQHAT